MDINLINLDAAARADVVPDVLSITFSATETADTSAAVTAELRRRLAAALAIANSASVALSPKEVELKTGGFTVQPVWVHGKGKQKPTISGYQGSASLVIYGSNQDVISEIAGKITSLDIAATEYSVSRALQTKTENDVLLAAISAFKDKAGQTARGFDAVAFNVVNLRISPENDYGGGRMRSKGAAMAMSVGASMESVPLEVEAGTTSIGVQVSGAIQLVPRGANTSAAITALLEVRPGQP